MIRNTLFGLSLLALTTGSAFAATKQTAAVKHPAAKTPVVAQAKTDAPAADGASTDKAAKKTTKKSTKKSAAKTEGKTDGAKEMKATPPASN
ncbi:MAG TPA: hypothetical protein VHG72_16440 [Polyangia bacterium]|nr:hypothetical protein [Polyangia bacterium]